MQIRRSWKKGRFSKNNPTIKEKNDIELAERCKNNANNKEKNSIGLGKGDGRLNSYIDDAMTLFPTKTW